MATTLYSSTSDVSDSFLPRAKSVAGQLFGTALASVRSWNDILIDRRIARFVRANGGVMTAEMERSLGDVAQGLPPRSGAGDLDRTVLAIMLLRS